MIYSDNRPKDQRWSPIGVTTGADRQSLRPPIYRIDT
jgi:hypothetical protein